MKYVKRILALPFFLGGYLIAVFFDLFKTSWNWLRYGGEFRVKTSEPQIDPQALLDELKCLNKNWERFFDEIN